MKKSIVVTLNIIKYFIKMFFRDKRAIFFSLFMPLLIMSIFGVMDFSKAAEIKISIADEAKNEASEKLTETLRNIDIFVISEGTKDEEKGKVEKGDIDMLLVIPEGFGEASKVLPSVATAPGSPNAPPTSVQTPQTVELFYAEGGQNSNTQVGITIISEVLDKYSHAITKTPSLFTLDARAVESRDLSYIDYILPGIVGLGVMMMAVMGVVGTIVEWRKKEVLRRILATPVHPRVIIFGQVVTRLLLSIMQTAVIITVGVLAFGVTIVGSYPLIFTLAILGGIIFLSIGFAISGLGNSQNTVMAMANVILMPMMFLSGVFFPQEAFPDWLGNITQYLPLTYLADGLREVMINGAGVVEIQGEIIGLVVWAVISFILAIKLFRWE
jgi:ABC-2 type transport system permease protein